jgi:hypothetical protein
LSLVVEAIFNVAAVILLGSFIGDNIEAPRFAVPAALLDLFAIALSIALIRQIVIARQIDYTKPIAAIQRNLENLRVLRIRYTQVLLVFAVLAWPPLCIVLFKTLFGLDAWVVFGSAYLWTNVLLGIAVIPLAIWASKRFGKGLSRSSIMRYLVRTISGRSLNEATGFLATLSEFEHEPSK